MSVLPSRPAPVSAAQQAPSAVMSNLSLNGNTAYNEKQNGFPTPSATPVAPPPAYPTPVPAYSAIPVILAHATSLYAYNPTDAGDLALLPNDNIAVTEYMNAEWWKGRNERTGQEGIFPRSYVRVNEDKRPMITAPQPSNYGNMPLDVSQSGGSAAPAVGPDGKVPNKGAEMGKKFGKKLGNAAIFGAGATVGSNIVNSIF